jgi:inhibitor of cysteine peptidase
MGRRLRYVLVCLLLAVLGTWGCSRPSGPPEAIYGEAQVDSIEMSIVEEFPARVTVIVNGNLKDDCTKIESVRQELVGYAFIVTIAVERPVDKACVQKDALFTATVPLSVENLPAGQYTVTVNGVLTSFEWHGAEGPPVR